MRKNSHPGFAILFVVLVSTGCAKGMFWQTGKLSPWARNQWAEEEKIADTLFSKKKRMDDSVAAVKHGSLESRQKVAEELAQILATDSILLIRLHAVKLLGEVDCPAAIDALEDASQDSSADLRIAVVDAWRKKSPDVAIFQLQTMIGSDTDVDVRLAATRALGGFSGGQAVRALGLALNDPNPALQLRAADSLRTSTGQPFGRDIAAWQNYVQQNSGSPESPQPATRTADQNPFGLFRSH
jgi:HEAT repeat protein